MVKVFGNKLNNKSGKDFANLYHGLTLSHAFSL